MTETSSTTNPALEPPSPGHALATARHRCSLSITELAQRTKIRGPVLRALEEDRYADLPPARVYVRGFVRTFAIAVGLEPDEITAHYLEAWQRWRSSQPG